MNFLCLALATLTSIAGIKESCQKQEIGRTFQIRASIADPNQAGSNSAVIHDNTGSITLHGDAFDSFPNLTAGDIIEAHGRIIRHPPGTGLPFADHITHIGHGAAPQPTNVTIADVNTGAYDEEFVRLKGIVFDALHDDVDDHFSFFILRQGQDVIYAYVSEQLSSEQLADIIGAEVSVIGAVTSAHPREYLGRTISLRGLDALTIIRRNVEDPNIAEDLLRLDSRDLVGNTIAIQRRQAEGRVLAVWQGKNILLQADDDRLVRVELAKGKTPDCGKRVRAIGLPETDLFSLNLVRASWQLLPDTAASTTRVQKADSGANLFRTAHGHQRIDTSRYGHLLDLSGIVKSVPRAHHGETAFTLTCDDQDIPVDIGNHPQILDTLQPGAKVKVRGILVLDTLPWHPQTPFPHIRGVLLALRAPTDITILSTAPWWTPAKLLTVIGLLFAVIIGILIWNASLRILAERRGRALLAAQIDTLASKLKTDERTRLAVELHDSLAQNLTGVSMEIETALRSKALGVDTVMRHLAIADKALKSCRSDLRNSLWDLRNQALDEPDLTAAIRKTLLPHLKDVACTIDVSVPRTRFSDQTAHELLRIIRELVLNAIRHGGATAIQIVGTTHDDQLDFSVTDNGSGFDPDTCPGVTEGHFGLQGVRERLRVLHGTLTFTRQTNGGMTAQIKAIT